MKFGSGVAGARRSPSGKIDSCSRPWFTRRCCWRSPSRPFPPAALPTDRPARGRRRWLHSTSRTARDSGMPTSRPGHRVSDRRAQRSGGRARHRAGRSLHGKAGGGRARHLRGEGRRPARHRNDPAAPSRLCNRGPSSRAMAGDRSSSTRATTFRSCEPSTARRTGPCGNLHFRIPRRSCSWPEARGRHG